jgi:O-antigen ligase
MVFFVSVPRLCEDQRYRDKLVIFLLAAFDILAAWAFLHHGVGEGGFLGDENDAGVALGIGVSFAALLTAAFPGRLWKAFTVASAIACAGAVVATNSRGGFLGLVAAILAIVWFSRKKLRILAVALMLAALAYPLLPRGYVDERLASARNPNDPTRAERIYGWHRGWDMYLDYPLIGVGAGNFAWRVGEYDSTEKAIQEREERRSLGGRAAHSVYFQLLPETGTVGVALYAFLLFGSLRIGNRVGRAGSGGDLDYVDRALARACAAGLVSLSVSGAFVSVLFYPHFWMLTGLAGYVRQKATHAHATEVAAGVQ